jgi:hypothetical protein
MADDNRIEIVITMDNGSVLKGLAQVEDKAKVTGDKTHDALSGSFGKFEEEAKSTFGKFGSILEYIPMAVIPIGAAILAVKEAFDFTLEGEKLLSIQKRFEFMAEREGISAHDMEKSLEKVSNGLIQMDDLLQSSTRSIATFGANAARMPELLSVAKNASITLGLNTLETYENLARAIESGNQKGLKHAGIILDVNKVYEAYANKIHLTASELNETQKQAALLEAAIDKGSKTFDGAIANSVNPATVAFKQLGITIAELHEKKMKSFAENSSSFFALIGTGLNNMIKGFSGTRTVADDIALLNAKLVDAKKNLEGFEKQNVGGLLQGEVDRRKQNISALEKEISLKKQSVEVVAGKTGSSVSPEIAASIAAKNQLDEIQKAAIQKRQDQVDAALTASEASEIASREKMLIYNDNQDQVKLLKKQLLSDKLVILQDEEDAKISAAMEQFSAKNGFDQQQRNDVRLSIEEDYALKKKDIEMNLNDDLVKSAELSRQRVSAITAAVGSALTGVISTSLQALGASLVKGMSSFEEARKSIIGLVGDMMISIGMSIITTSTLIEAFKNSIIELFGGSGIAAGAALVVAGGALKAMAGASLSSAASPGAAGFSGSSSSSSSPSMSAPQIASETPAGIILNIHGDVLDSQESGLRIVNLINSAFQNQGAVLVTA